MRRCQVDLPDQAVYRGLRHETFARISIRYRQPTTELFFERLPNTLSLIPATVCWTILAAMPLGILAAVSHGTLFDRWARTLAVCGLAAPSFWLGVMLI